jgi:hypothetical protein
MPAKLTLLAVATCLATVNLSLPQEFRLATAHAAESIKAATTEIAAGQYSGACQVMKIGPDGAVSYDDTPLAISHVEITADGMLQAEFPDSTLGRGKWHTLTLKKVSTQPRVVWSAVSGDKTYQATAIPFSPRAYVFRLEVRRNGRLISGAQQFYAVDLQDNQ